MNSRARRRRASVGIANFAFLPAARTIAAGETVNQDLHRTRSRRRTDRPPISSRPARATAAVSTSRRVRLHVFGSSVRDGKVVARAAPSANY